MEKAIQKTLMYADIFDYPLKAWEIHKWLIKKKANLREVEKSLRKLLKTKKILQKSGYYFLPDRQKIVAIRQRREGISKKQYQKIMWLAKVFKIIPWILFVGISGSLAVKNSEKNSDIDLFIVTKPNRLWISRLTLLSIISLFGLRRTRSEKATEVSGKVCPNIVLDSDSLDQQGNNVYLAHEVLQLSVLWQREGSYQLFLENNLWAFEWLPNWSSDGTQMIANRSQTKRHHTQERKPLAIFDLLERLSKTFQLWYMKKPRKKERVSETSLYFHPEDKSEEILKKYQQRIKTI